ncbi:MAG: SDR family oxidoreductase [Gammaproteobacteria bacterium]|nr:SDR family oxidoreductase [Gammaproteobacteria bacterium]
MNSTFRYVACALLLFVCASPAATVHADDGDAQLAVLVTGASSGIGRKTTEVLAERGYFVYAGARKQKDLDALNEIDNVQAIRLDVTIQEEIDAAVETVRDGGRGLHGLVNNAGVFIGGPMMDVSVNEMRWLFDINVMGVYRVTQAFAPMIIESKGRITTIGSIAGILGTTFFSQYSASKHAIEGFTDSLADEMERFGVEVSVVEPGNYNSKISASGFRRMAEKDYAKEGSPFAEDFQKMLARGTDRSMYKEPDEVAEAVAHALFTDDPKRRYLVVPNAQEAEWTIGQIITELVQLNHDQPYEYTRDELIEMLDQAITTTQKNP